jgi:hypothetical protein
MRVRMLSLLSQRPLDGLSLYLPTEGAESRVFLPPVPPLRSFPYFPLHSHPVPHILPTSTPAVLTTLGRRRGKWGRG